MFINFIKRSLHIALYLIIVTIFSCVTVSTPLPDWIEVKPKNSSDVIYFSYGPTNSRESAQKGIYKVISEYFGVQVSSVDKYIRDIEFVNGVTAVNESKSSTVDLTAREKGLDSVEILEVWNDNGDRWCILASLGTKAANRIKTQVEEEIERERLAALLIEGENYLNEIESDFKTLKSERDNLERLILRLEQSLTLLESMSSADEILKESTSAIGLLNEVNNLENKISELSNSIRLNYKKSELLLPKIGGEELTTMQMGFFIDSANTIIDSLDSISSSRDESTKRVDSVRTSLESYRLESELVILGDTESQKKDLESIIADIEEDVLNIRQYSDQSELLIRSSENSYLDIKLLSRNNRLSSDEKANISSELLEGIKVNLETLRSFVTLSRESKDSIELNFTSVKASPHISEKKFNELDTLILSINEPISWLNIIENKLGVIYAEARELTEEFLLQGLLNKRLDEFRNNFLTVADNGLTYSIGDFIYEDSGISSTFSDYLNSHLNTLLSTGLNLIDYSVITEYYFTQGVNPRFIYEGRDSSLVDAVIYGDYWLTNDSVEIHINVISTETSEVLYSEKLTVPVEAISRDLSLKPENIETVLNLNSRIKGHNIDELEIWPDRGSGSLYRDGDNMVINLRTPMDGYVKIYHISADNEMTMIFPNQYEEDNRVYAGEYYTYGDINYPFRFTLGRPYGVESLKVVFSEEQFSDLIRSVYSDMFMYRGVRGIQIERRLNSDLIGNTFSATSFYTIIE